MQYRHTQTGGFVIAMAAVIIVALFIAPVPPGGFILVALVLVATCALFYSLTVAIDTHAVTCSFGIGIISKTIPLLEIQHAQAVRNPWYLGWGIRWMPAQYWSWNISGLGAVELTLAGDKRFRIGTDEPEALASAIETARSINRKQTSAP